MNNGMQSDSKSDEFF